MTIIETVYLYKNENERIALESKVVLDPKEYLTINEALAFILGYASAKNLIDSDETNIYYPAQLIELSIIEKGQPVQGVIFTPLTIDDITGVIYE